MKHLPKIIGGVASVLLSTILLTSCGQPSVNEDFSKAFSDHVNAFYALVNPLETTGFKGINHADANITINAKDQVEGKASLNIDSKVVNQESLSDIGIAWDGTINKEALKVDAKASIGAFSGKLYAKLQNLDFSGALIGPMKEQIDSVVFLLKDKWFVQDLTKLGSGVMPIKLSSQLTMKDIVNILTSKPVFRKKADLPITDNFYRYAVEFDAANMVEIMKSLTEKMLGEPMPADEITTMQEELSKTLFDGTLAIDSKNPAYMMLSGTFSQSGSTENTMNVSINFLRDTIDFVATSPSEKTTASLHLTRKDNTFSGPLSIENGNNPENNVNVMIAITTKTDGFSTQFDTAIPNPQNPTGKINLSIIFNFSSTKDDTMTIEEPKDAKAFEELAKSFMGTETLPIDNGGTTNDSGTIDTSIEELTPATETGAILKDQSTTESGAKNSLQIEIPASK
jgi:hypothetical protein